MFFLADHRALNEMRLFAKDMTDVKVLEFIENFLKDFEVK